MIAARAATDGDRDALAALRDLARADAAAKRGGDALLTDAASFGEPDLVVVGCIGEGVVGFATVRRRPDAAVVDALFTHPDARDVGVGHAMLGLVTETARAWGVTALDSYALPGDRDTKNFFESHGMKSRVLVVRTTL